MEREIARPRYLIDSKCVTWPDVNTDLQNWTVKMCLKVEPEFWGPRNLMRDELVWDEAQGTLSEVLYRCTCNPPVVV